MLNLWADCLVGCVSGAFKYFVGVLVAGGVLGCVSIVLVEFVGLCVWLGGLRHLRVAGGAIHRFLGVLLCAR